MAVNKNPQELIFQVASVDVVGDLLKIVPGLTERSKEKVVNADVIVVGAGLAGMMAARTACEEGANVLLLSRKSIGLASNSAMSNGAFAGPSSSYGSDAYVRDTLLIGKMLNSTPRLEAAAKGVGVAMDFLRSLGCHISETHGHYVVESPRVDAIRGVTLVKSVAESLKKAKGLTVLTEFHATELLKHEKRVCGVEGFGRDGRSLKLLAPALVLATGGAGAIYLRNDNQKSTLGQGYRLALRAGLELRDMEFVQFFPFVLAEPGLPSQLLYPPIPREARLMNASKEDLSIKWGLGGLNDMILGKRDEISALLYEAGQAGTVYMDYREVPASCWDSYPLAMLNGNKFDFRNKPFAVSPAAHFFMGGIRTDEQTQSEMPGLFACGEVSWGLHGANRRGGNALTECMVFGKIAGTNASRWGLAHPLKTGNIETDTRNDIPFGSVSAVDALRGLARTIREIAWNCAGVVRSEEGLRSGLVQLKEVDEKLGTIDPVTVAEKIRKVDQLSASLVLKAILTASLAREESLGSFKRKDFPNEQKRSRYGNSRIVYDAKSEAFSVAHCCN